MAALITQDYLEQKVQRGNRSKFDNALANGKDVEPEPNDKL